MIKLATEVSSLGLTRHPFLEWNGRSKSLSLGLGSSSSTPVLCDGRLDADERVPERLLATEYNKLSHIIVR